MKYSCYYWGYFATSVDIEIKQNQIELSNPLESVVPEWVLFDSSDHNKDFFAFLYVQYAQKMIIENKFCK